MSSSAFLDRSLGDLARSIPGATAIFHRHQLDFCCGGKQSLRDALAPQGLDPQPITDALLALQDQPGSEAIDWRGATAAELIDHILVRYHERHREQLPELVRLSRRVETVHADRPECPHGLADHLEDMLQELESHMQKEEQILFPLIAQGMSPTGLPPVEVMRFEHDQHGQSLAQMVSLAHGLVMPRGACNTWRALLAGLQTLREDLMQHIHLENNVLFEGLNAPEAATEGGCGGACACAGAAA
ncbi:iron-sulfur cluster repair protein YtfE [Ideonella dechloratans]|uniref:iron-sulfur cluster repair protein YtfE n=1 Tax=Ideonella dechloratans TaxID=36863 RepID=UPI0035B28540